MRDHAQSEPTRYDALTLAAATWLACGLVLFGLTPLPWRDATLGWSPLFWLIAAPCVLLVARRAFPSRAEEAPRRQIRPLQRNDVPASRRRRSHAARTRRAAA
ncbi:MAG: hypothetical protein OJF61_002862 [Rhodanobacteraceae bacterium]|jgi:hypothetical protein|nr:MAG: hypothetical protein OJF61_002862 [Rhodanobacteraceae bacterium]